VGEYAKNVVAFCKWYEGIGIQEETHPDQVMTSNPDWPRTLYEYLDFYAVKQGNAKTSSRTMVAALKKWLETSEISPDGHRISVQLACRQDLET
jgi:hypothetical protein